MKWATVLVLALAVMVLSNGQPAIASHNDIGCVDWNGNGQVDVREVLAVVAAYFNPGHPLAPPPPPPSQLSDTTEADLWVYLSDEERSDGTVVLASADPAFDIDVFDLAVFVDGTSYCNSSRIYADDGPHELGCSPADGTHADVQYVSAQTTDYPDLLGDLRCERHSHSNDEQSVFACEWRASN